MWWWFIFSHKPHPSEHGDGVDVLMVLHCRFQIIAALFPKHPIWDLMTSNYIIHFPFLCYHLLTPQVNFFLSLNQFSSWPFSAVLQYCFSLNSQQFLYKKDHDPTNFLTSQSLKYPFPGILSSPLPHLFCSMVRNQ